VHSWRQEDLSASSGNHCSISANYSLVSGNHDVVSTLQFAVLKIEQVASNKSSLLLNIILQNTQVSQLFTIKIKTESILKGF